MSTTTSVDATISGTPVALTQIIPQLTASDATIAHNITYGELEIHMESLDFNALLRKFAEWQKSLGVHILFTAIEPNGEFYYTNYLNDFYHVDFYTTNPDFQYNAIVPATQIADTIMFLTHHEISSPDEVDDWNEAASEEKDTWLTVHHFDCEEDILNN